jgi:hypothetical protein
MICLNDPETEVLHHRGKIAVIVQEFMTVLDAKCPDDDVNGFADCNSTLPQKSVIPRRLDGQGIIKHLHHSKLPHGMLDLARANFVTCTLQYLEQNQVAYEDLVFFVDSSEFLYCFAVEVAQIRNPDRAVHHDH